MSSPAGRELPLVSNTSSVRELMRVVDRGAMGVALVVDEQRHLEATLTDGDIRRALLSGLDLEDKVSQVIDLQTRQRGGSPKQPVVAPVGSPVDDLRLMMAENAVRQIPVVDENGCVVDIVLESDFLVEPELSLQGFIMAGGFGKRLMPLTKDVPKPMLPLNGKPILEHLVSKLRTAGIRRVNISTFYLADNIKQHFRDGKDFGVDIAYVHEDRPMGTAGALSKLCTLDEPVLIVNGDILTSVDFRAMLNYHRDQAAEMTIAVRRYEMQVPYGVVETDGVSAVAIVEKPMIRHFINAGIYLVQPNVCTMVPTDRPFDMPDLIKALIAEGKRVVCFPIREYWVDIGHVEQYNQAASDTALGIV